MLAEHLLTNMHMTHINNNVKTVKPQSKKSSRHRKQRSWLNSAFHRLMYVSFIQPDKLIMSEQVMVTHREKLTSIFHVREGSGKYQMWSTTYCSLNRTMFRRGKSETRT